ncbi:MAG: arginyltransferase [Alphaproteobacteria bacterium]|nr:arginyltransferase [Alphaproteobacteria bacterium]
MNKPRSYTARNAPPIDRTRPDGPLIQFFATPPEPCPYLAGRLERKLLTPLTGSRAPFTYDDLIKRGFRRSHTVAYRPACRQCDACVPVRIVTREFEPSRNLKRSIRVCASWRAEEFAEPTALPAHYRLFQRYQATRHTGGNMARMSFAEYRSMVEESFVHTRLAEFRNDAGALQGIAIYDRVENGLSALYQFFEPDLESTSPGSFMIAWMVERALSLGLDHVYLGYYIGECRKMAYKARFQPLEALGADGRWAPFEPVP